MAVTGTSCWRHLRRLNLFASWDIDLVHRPHCEILFPQLRSMIFTCKSSEHVVNFEFTCVGFGADRAAWFAAETGN